MDSLAPYNTFQDGELQPCVYIEEDTGSWTTNNEVTIFFNFVENTESDLALMIDQEITKHINSNNNCYWLSHPHIERIVEV